MKSAKRDGDGVAGVCCALRSAELDQFGYDQTLLRF